MQWLPLSTIEEANTIISSDAPMAIFKHSTRCSISSMAKSRIERAVLPNIPFYYLDLLAYRNVSDYIASTVHITHQSPQLIVVKDGTVLYHASHNSIDIEELTNILEKY